MGKPHPLKMPEQNAPSFVPRTSNAIRIQRVTFPCEQQFIKTSCFPQDVCILDKINVLGVDSCGFSFYYIVFLRALFCVLKCHCMAKISLS